MFAVGLLIWAGQEGDHEGTKALANYNPTVKLLVAQETKVGLQKLGGSPTHPNYTGPTWHQKNAFPKTPAEQPA
jgi:hypothetical protein